VIRQVHIVNFRCIRDLTLALEPLTVLVGPNGSGKSAVLAALNPGLVLQPWDHWQLDQALEVRREWSFAKSGSGALVQRAGHGYSTVQVLSNWRHQDLRLDLQRIRQANQLQLSQQLTSDGSNLANVFGTLTRKQKGELAQQLCSLVPLFLDVDITPTQAGMHQLRFQDRWSPSLWYDPGAVSDGTMLLVAFLTLQYQSPPVDVVAIEEPERGLHPYLVEQLVGFLRKLSRGELGPRRIQVVLATHSPELLDYVRPEEVRFLSRRPEDGSVTATSVATADPDWPRYFREYRESLKEAWLSGGLGGAPGYEPAARS